MGSSTVPERRAVAIHYPGYVSDTQAALDSMGGVPGITRSHSNNDKDPLQVLCRPGCALAPRYVLSLPPPLLATPGSA